MGCREQEFINPIEIPLVWSSGKFLLISSISLGVVVSQLWRENSRLELADTQQVTQLRKHEAAVVHAAACLKVNHLCSVKYMSGQSAQ